MPQRHAHVQNLWAIATLLLGVLLFAVYAAWRRHDALVEEQRAAFQPITPSSYIASHEDTFDSAILKADTSEIFDRE